MGANEQAPKKTPTQDQVAVLCITVVGIIVLIVLKVNASNYVDTLITMAELALPAASALARVAWQLLRNRDHEQDGHEAGEPASTLADGALDEPPALRNTAVKRVVTGCGCHGQDELDDDANE